MLIHIGSTFATIYTMHCLEISKYARMLVAVLTRTTHTVTQEDSLTSEHIVSTFRELSENTISNYLTGATVCLCARTVARLCLSAHAAYSQS